jgi:hypothetical protein
MKPANLKFSALLLCLLPLPGALAQQGTPPTTAPQGTDIPRPDQLEPGVNTTPAAPASGGSLSPSGDSAASPGAAPKVAAPQAAPGNAADSAAARKDAAAKAPARKAGPDRLQLDTTDITGNRELPKVLYIVPWKRSDLGDLMGKPPNSLLDEVLQPLDRDVFQRENRYYDDLKPDAAPATAPAVEGADKGH